MFCLHKLIEIGLIRIMSTSKDFYFINDHKVRSVDILSFGFVNENI